jgi:hypothetical protein
VRVLRTRLGAALRVILSNRVDRRAQPADTALTPLPITDLYFLGDTVGVTETACDEGYAKMESFRVGFYQPRCGAFITI